MDGGHRAGKGASDGSDGRRRFGAFLADAMRARAMKQEDLAGQLGTTQSSVSGWTNGKYEPSAETVFAIERLLELAPGHLSGHLGYLPLDAASGPTGVAVVIARSAALDDEDKAVLISLYELLAAKRARSITARRSGNKATANRARLTASGTSQRPSGSASTRRTAAGGR